MTLRMAVGPLGQQSALGDIPTVTWGTGYQVGNYENTVAPDRPGTQGECDGVLLLAFVTQYADDATVSASGWTVGTSFRDTANASQKVFVLWKIGSASEPASTTFTFTEYDYNLGIQCRVTGANIGGTPDWDQLVDVVRTRGKGAGDETNDETGFAGGTTTVNNCVLVGSLNGYDSTPGDESMTDWGTADASYDSHWASTWTQDKATAGTVTSRDTGETEANCYSSIWIALHPVGGA